MRQVTITMTTPWSLHRPYSTSLYGRSSTDITGRVAAAIRKYAAKHGLPVGAVDYELVWGGVA